jgi:hypothetical protein
MKQCFIIIVLSFLFFNNHLSAQRFQGGALLGFNASQVDGDTYSGYNKFGFMGGAFVYTKLSDMFDIQMEIKYMGKGASKRSTQLDPTIYKSKLNYIEIPVLLKVKTKSKVDLQGGLGFGYLFSYSEEDAYGVLPSDATVPFRPFELSSIIGGTYRFAPKFFVDLRYSYSILSIVKTPPVAYTYFRHSGVFNNLFSVGLYYTLGK